MGNIQKTDKQTTTNEWVWNKRISAYIVPMKGKHIEYKGKKVRCTNSKEPVFGIRIGTS